MFLAHSEALPRHRKRLLDLENVAGVGVGYKEVSGRKTDQPALVVLVKQKRPKSELIQTQMVPAHLDGIQTDVIEVGEIRLLGIRTEKQRPAFPGISIGHYKITAGTFGAVVFDRETGEPMILSNNHVLANETNGRDGRSKVGDPILQPGVADGGRLGDDTIARLERFVPVLGPENQDGYCPLRKMAQRFFAALGKPLVESREIKPLAAQENIVDAAVALPLQDGLVNANILGIGLVIGVTEATPGMRVQKSGRTSGVTHGEVRVIKATVKVGMSGGSEYIFSDQVVLDAMSEPGDSGSLVVDEQRRAVGLLFAGSESSTICNRIQNVLDTLSVRI